LADSGTDKMRLVLADVELESANDNLPTLNGQSIDLSDFRNELLNGFRHSYRALWNGRRGLVASDGPLSPFHDVEVRFILRPTPHYSLVLNSSMHPQIMRDGVALDWRLDRILTDISDLPGAKAIIAAERHDLWEGDIPIFTTTASSRDLQTSGGTIVPEFFAESGMARVERLCAGLGNEDLARECWLIETMVEGADIRLDELDEGELAAIEGRQGREWALHRRGSLARSDVIAAARDVGTELERLAVRSGEEASWLTALLGKGYYAVGGATHDLYDGLSGICLFFAYLGAVTRDDRFTSTARAALSSARKQAERSQGQMPAETSIGPYTGISGYVYLLQHLAALWRDPQLLREATEYVEPIRAAIPFDETYDVIGGAAGAIRVLLNLAAAAPDSDASHVAEQCGDHLVACAVPAERGCGWIVDENSPPLAGYAHGGAGIAWALARLGHERRIPRFTRVARLGVLYERSLFQPETGNWLDLRVGLAGAASDVDVYDQDFMAHWCHGAVGIGLARLDAYECWHDSAVDEEIETALATTLQRGFGLSHCLCHGDLGNVEFLQQAANSRGSGEYRQVVEAIAAGVLDQIGKSGYVSGVPGRIRIPGLMRGLAGIGFGLLRIASPASVPSVLLLEPPPG